MNLLIQDQSTMEREEIFSLIDGLEEKKLLRSMVFEYLNKYSGIRFKLDYDSSNF